MGSKWLFQFFVSITPRPRVSVFLYAHYHRNVHLPSRFYGRCTQITSMLIKGNLMYICITLFLAFIYIILILWYITECSNSCHDGFFKFKCMFTLLSCFMYCPTCVIKPYSLHSCMESSSLNSKQRKINYIRCLLKAKGSHEFWLHDGMKGQMLSFLYKILNKKRR